MIPERKLASQQIYSHFKFPGSLTPKKLEAYEHGSLTLSDPTGGLEQQAWKLTYSDPDVIITPMTSGSPSTLFSIAGITEFDLAFDQNMNPFVTYVVNGDAWYWWYDPLLPGQAHVQLPAGITTPRCTLDDKRDGASSYSDIILAYIKDGDLRFLEQGDRFFTEYTLMADVQPPYLNRVGMNEDLRLQFYLRASA